MSLYLFKTKRFAPLFVTQFLGAFNDNLYKNTLAVLLTFESARWTTISPALLAPIIGAIFIAPFFLFSGVAGDIADRIDKARLARVVKVWEMVMMALALTGFLMHSFALLLVVLFGMGMHSTLFGPIKYSIIPQHMKEGELIGANALIESGTFGAILLGTIIGGLFAAIPEGGAIASAIALSLATVGYISSRYIPDAKAPQRDDEFKLGIWRHSADAIALAKKDRVIFLAILAISWFWLYGALLLSQFPSLVKQRFYGDEMTVTTILAIFTIGIGVGSMICEKLSHHRVKKSLIAAGALGMALFGADFAYTLSAFTPSGELLLNHDFVRILLDIAMLGLFGGIYSVPLYALVQERSPAEARSRIIAANNILNALFMVFVSLAVITISTLGVDVSWLFGAVAIVSGGVGLMVSFRKKR